MKTLACIMAVLMAFGGGNVCAQTQAPDEPQAAIPPGLTHLHLSADGAISEQPDVQVGNLTAEATSAPPAEAQGKVNALMAQSMKDAHAVEGVEARAMGYAVNQVDLDEGAVPVRPMMAMRMQAGPPPQATA